MMNVRKIVESYEQEFSSIVKQPPPNQEPLRPRPPRRSRPPAPHTSPAPNQRPLRTQRPPSLKIVKEEGPVTTVLKECTNGLQIVQRPNASRISVSLTPDASHTLGHPSMTSAKLLCAIVPPSFGFSGPPAPHPGVPARPTLQPRASLRARRQQRYSRDESALATALRRSTEYERVIPPKPPMQYATKQLEARINDAKARLTDVRDLLRDDTTDQVTYHASLRTRWMAERWIAAAEKELSRANTLTGYPVSSDTPLPSAQKTRRDANLAYFFTHSPTRTTTLPAQRLFPRPLEQPRRISKHNVEAPQLSKWPLTTTLREPMNLKPFPSMSYDTNSKNSVSSPLPPSPLSPKQPYPHELDMGSPLSESSLLPGVSTASTLSTVPDTPVDDSGAHIWSGFAVIYIPSQPSDEELLAALGADMEAEPIPEYATYLLNQLETIGEGVILPSLSRRESTASSGFEFISRPSIEVYEYPMLPRSRMLIRRSMRVCPPALGILSGLRTVREDPSPLTSPRILTAHGHEFPRPSVFSKVRRSITGQQ
ncbi:hypothetical protein BJV78DRAFT_1285944 [Lactifluus subvellereus]|nr:hypothetical protein BJV78DRAFT_1285944 [Lactifluus subvellereus]